MQPIAALPWVTWPSFIYRFTRTNEVQMMVCMFSLFPQLVFLFFHGFLTGVLTHFLCVYIMGHLENSKRSCLLFGHPEARAGETKVGQRELQEHRVWHLTRRSHILQARMEEVPHETWHEVGTTVLITFKTIANNELEIIVILLCPLRRSCWTSSGLSWVI